METITEYYNGINAGDYYLCDKCNVAKLSLNEYVTNIRDIENSIEKMRYCNECRNYLILKKWKCNVCKSTGNTRNERELTIKHCDKVVSII